MNLRQISGIARPIEPGYPTNRWIAVLTLLVLIAGGVWRLLDGDGWLTASGWSASAAVSFFLAWALARELDPDRELAAFVAAGFTLPALAAAGLGWLPLPDLAALFLVLLAMRVMNRSTGVAATVPDTVGLLGLGLWLGYESSPIYLAVAVAALLIDALLGPADRRRVILAVLAATIGGVLVAIGDPPYAPPSPPTSAPMWVPVPVLAALIMSAIFAVTIRAADQVQSLADATAEPLSPRRVRAGQLLALLTALGLTLAHGSPGLTGLLPLWAAMAATGAYRIAAGRKPAIPK
ncbi:hypothetical protein [Thiocapsa bogorovii]|uniref:hypothetical protein n=1 Tax=Thiocapsa bogorovii TaxID=521689 RepID=UPI001E60F559|nr:hypothetical protein [Thiocapsa bogorovii]UHD17932.1 hypothetical protein LT988_07800 [Thiocapsa bogorovii]